MEQKDTLKRSFVKTLFFKIITTSITAVVTGIGTALLLHLVLTLVYLGYERIWNRITWGKKTVDPIVKKEEIPTVEEQPLTAV